MSHIDIGDIVDLLVTVRDAETEAIIPPSEISTVVFTVRKPDGTIQVPTVDTSQAAQGIYKSFVEIDQAQEWWWSVDVDGLTVSASDEDHFIVGPRKVTRSS